MFINRKNDIKEFPFHDCSTLGSEQLSVWAEEHSLSAFNSWMLPQMVAHFGNFKVRKNEEGLYDPKALMQDNINSKWDIGLWRVVTKMKRSSLVKSQSAVGYSEYSALVPLILSGLKKYQDIPYSEWSRDGLGFTMDEGLFLAMMYEVPDITVERLLEIRYQGLLNKSGKNAGTLKPSISTWKLTGIKNTELGEAPTLAVTMLAQTWVAHPSVRSKYMVLNPKDWDDMPDPLVTTGVTTIAPTDNSLALPWQ